MKKTLFLLLIGIFAKAELVYQGANPLTIGSYNVTTQSAIPLTFKNTGAAISSLSGGITGTNSSDFKISLNRCNNVLVNKSCQVSIAAISKTISLGAKSISVGGANLNITVVKLDANGQVIIPPSSNENLEFTPASLADLQFVPGEKYKTVSLSVKNSGSVAVTPAFSWSSNSANVSFLLNRCSVSLNPNKSCAISLRIPAPPSDIIYSQDYQASSSSQLRDSLAFVIKGVVGGSNLSCNYNSQTYAHGASVPGFSAATVAFGSLCSSVAVNGTCNNGVISNQPAFPSCSVSSPANCDFAGHPVPHGVSTITAYQSATVPYGSSCVSETRACNNGTLSGSYTYESCSVLPGSTCLIDGQTFQPNDIITGYLSLQVYSPSTCGSSIETFCDGTTGLPNNPLVTALSCTQLPQPGILTLDLAGASYKVVSSADVVVSQSQGFAITGQNHYEINLPAGNYTVYIPGEVSVGPPRYLITPQVVEAPFNTTSFCKSATGTESFGSFLNNKPGYYCELLTSIGSGHSINLNTKIRNGYGVLIDGEAAATTLLALTGVGLFSNSTFVDGLCEPTAYGCGFPQIGPETSDDIFEQFIPGVGHIATRVLGFNPDVTTIPDVGNNNMLSFKINSIGKTLIPISHSSNLTANIASINLSNPLGKEFVPYQISSMNDVIFSVVKIGVYNEGCQDSAALGYDPLADTQGMCMYQDWQINFENGSNSFLTMFTSTEGYIFNNEFSGDIDSGVPLFGGIGNVTSTNIVNGPLKNINSIYFQFLDNMPTNIKCRKQGDTIYENGVLTYIATPMTGYQFDLPPGVIANPTTSPQIIECFVE